jgi:hypothetical protein
MAAMSNAARYGAGERPPRSTPDRSSPTRQQVVDQEKQDQCARGERHSEEGVQDHPFAVPAVAEDEGENAKEQASRDQTKLKERHRRKDGQEDN